MFQHQLEQQNKSIARRIADVMAGWVPRKATVARPEQNGVWVRFDTEKAAAPESWFVSTVSGVTSGTTGWVITLGGGKGLFVATGIPKPDANSGGAGTQPAISTSGDYPITAAAATISGLAPGKVRKVVGTVTFRASGTSGQASMGMHMVGAATTFLGPGTVVISSAAAGLAQYTFTYSDTRTVAPDGTLSVVPCVRWAAGTVNVSGAFATIQVL